MSGLGQSEASKTAVGEQIQRRYVRLLSPARYDRLEGSLQVARVEIERRFDPLERGDILSPVPEPLPSGMSWKDAARSLLTEAEHALARGKIDQGWKLLHAARRLEIFGLLESEVPGFTASLRAEAEKLKTWRQKAVHAIVGTIEAPKTATIQGLAEAALIRDEHYNNQGYKDQLLRTQILFLVAILAVVMAGIIGLAYAGTLPSGQVAPPSNFYMLIAVMLFGNLGGTTSAMLRASDPASSARIPELTSANRVTFMRILLGGASAVVVYLALQSQLTGVFNQTVADAMKSLTTATVYVVVFVAGFTERLVLRAVEVIAGKLPSTPAKEDQAARNDEKPLSRNNKSE